MDEVEGVQAGRALPVAEQAVEVGQAVRIVRHRFAVEHDALTGEGAQRALMATSLSAQSRPCRDHRRTSPPSLRATMRKPSCFSSCRQPSPADTLSESTGLQGWMKPGGLSCFGLAQRVGVRINMDAPFTAQDRRESLRQLGAAHLRRNHLGRHQAALAGAYACL